MIELLNIDLVVNQEADLKYSEVLNQLVYKLQHQKPNKLCTENVFSKQVIDSNFKFADKKLAELNINKFDTSTMIVEDTEVVIDLIEKYQIENIEMTLNLFTDFLYLKYPGFAPTTERLVLETGLFATYKQCKIWVRRQPKHYLDNNEIRVF